MNPFSIVVWVCLTILASWTAVYWHQGPEPGQQARMTVSSPQSLSAYPVSRQAPLFPVPRET